MADFQNGTNHIDKLVSSEPGATDAIAETDDHIKFIKASIKETFPGLVGANYVSGATGTVTSTAAELNILDGVTATTAEINKLDGVTATATELSIMSGVTVTASEINMLGSIGATSLADQLAAKSPLASPEFTGTPTIASANVPVTSDTPSNALATTQYVKDMINLAFSWNSTTGELTINQL